MNASYNVCFENKDNLRINDVLLFVANKLQKDLEDVDKLPQRFSNIDKVKITIYHTGNNYINAVIDIQE